MLQKDLNESPSQKEGKSWVGRSFRIPAAYLNESPSKQEGKCQVMADADYADMLPQ